MIKSAQYHRLMWMTLLVVIAFCGLGWRLVDLQYLSAGVNWEEFEKRSFYEDVHMPWRGKIMDRNENVLTASIRNYNLGVDPSYNGSMYRKLASAIAPILKMDVGELATKIQPKEWVVQVDENTTKTNHLQFVPIAKEVPYDKWIQIKAALKTIGEELDFALLSKEQKESLANIRKKGVLVEREVQTRRYPNGNMAAPILGLVNSKEYRSPDGDGPTYFLQHGVNGIELVLDKQLSGTSGRTQVLRTELVEQIVERFPAKDGVNVSLTLDRRIQGDADRLTQQAMIDLSAKKVFITVMDVNTGEILALSGAPTFDPRDRATYTPERSRLLPLTEIFEPGSMIKVIPIAGAIEDGAVNLETSIFCENGRWSEPAKALTDTHPHGDLTVLEIVTKSSNIGTAKITKRHGHQPFYNYMVKFGIGRKTGIGLYEEAGILRPFGSYRPVTFTRLPIGYASGVTQLQIACAYSAIANGGTMVRPQILRNISDRNGNVIVGFQPRFTSRIISQQTSRDMLRALQTVTEPGGTATTAALEYYTVAGKTGTAHKYTGDPYAPYDDERYTGSFAGIFPATAPQICIVVTVVEPDKHNAGHYGGKVAGPIFAELARLTGQYLNIKPDKAPETSNQSQSPAGNR